MAKKEEMIVNNISRIRTNGKDINRIFGLFACLQELEYASSEMEKRFKVIPNGWRDVRMLIAVLDKLLDNVLTTVPPEKLPSIQRMVPQMQFKLVCGVQASRTDRHETIISDHEAEVLAKCAHEKCLFCPNERNCSKCPLGKVLDSVLSHDRDGDSWAWVDFNALE